MSNMLSALNALVNSQDASGGSRKPKVLVRFQLTSISSWGGMLGLTLMLILLVLTGN